MGPIRTRAGQRRLVISVAVSLAVVLIGSGLAFANSISASKVATNAASLHWANSASGTSALTRAALAQAITFTHLHLRGEADRSDLEFALDNVASSLGELEDLESAGGQSPSLALFSRFRSSAERTFTFAAQGNIESAMAHIDVLEGNYMSLVEALRSEQDAIQEAIAANTQMGQRVNGLIVFAMTLVIPVSAVTLYWWIARRQILQHREQARLELEAQRALGRAKDQFIAGLSHELRTPLTSIYGFAEILADGDPGSDPGEIASIIASEASELGRMVDDLLIASRLSSTGVEMEIVPTSIAPVVESAAAPFERAGVAIARNLNGTVAHVDPGRLRHILVNLISNASRHGGDQIGVEVSAASDSVAIEVWDNGPGVAEDKVDRLFTPYANDGHASILTGSVGLGLSVAASLAERMEGRLEYERFGGRTYFVITVPGGKDEPSAEPQESAADVIRSLA